MSLDKDLKKNVGAIIRRVRQNNIQAMTDVVFYTSIAAANKAPIDTERLRSKIYRTVKNDGGVVTGYFVFTRPYAKIQHDNLNYRHPKGGEALYAKKALIETSPAVMKIFARRALR